MAGIQTVDSAGKTTLALLGIGKQIQAGQTSQAKRYLQSSGRSSADISSQKQSVVAKK